jgi:Holliday junction DNA helicase RuvA
MIARLKGIVDLLADDSVIIDVHGVGYLVFCSSRTLSRMTIGEAISLEIETHVREDHIHLFGFADAAERSWFKLLTSVQGVGAKVGLAIQGILSGDELVQAVAAQDKASITRAPGVGPKLATRILSELKDKVGAMALGAAATQGVRIPASDGAVDTAGSSAVSDAASALVNLGYTPSDALGAVSRAAAQIEDEQLDIKADVESLIRAGLRELAAG